MYVDPFVCGVFVTIVVEIVACIIYAMVSSGKGGKK